MSSFIFDGTSEMFLHFYTMIRKIFLKDGSDKIAEGRFQTPVSPQPPADDSPKSNRAFQLWFHEKKIWDNKFDKMEASADVSRGNLLMHLGEQPMLAIKEARDTYINPLTGIEYNYQMRFWLISQTV
jgi:hypothetical protein